MNLMSLQKYLNTSRPELYVKLLARVFKIKDALGNVYNYEPLPYEVEWHKHFYLVNPSGRNRLWHKGRGVGATATTMMDLLMMASTYKGLKIPISSITGRQVLMTPIDWGRWLCDNTQIPGVIKRNSEVDSRIELTRTDSIIFPIPGNNPNALRSYRSPVIYYDEFDWCQKQRELLNAGNRCMSEGGQATVVSTIQNVRGEFQRLIDHAEELNYWVLETPIFPHEELDVTKPLTSQDLKPIAPWIDLGKLEEERKRDLYVFLRENQCVAPDVGANFLDWALINEVCTITDFQGSHWTRWRRKQRDSDNWINLGIDYARYKDLSVFEVLELTAFGWIQVYEQILRGSDTKAQNELINLLESNFHFNNIRVDMTGAGQGLYDYAYAKHGSRVEGVHFAEKMDVGEMRARKKDVYASNLRSLMQDGEIRLFDYLELKDDLHSVPYDLSDPKRTVEGSHGDRFWALALAAWRTIVRPPKVRHG
jgi:hypothetical protein